MVLNMYYTYMYIMSIGDGRVYICATLRGGRYTFYLLGRGLDGVLDIRLLIPADWMWDRRHWCKQRSKACPESGELRYKTLDVLTLTVFQLSRYCHGVQQLSIGET